MNYALPGKQSGESDRTYARVGVVHGATRAGQSYTYLIPASLAGQLIPGQLLLIPFGPRYRRGWLLALGDTLPPEMASSEGTLKHVARLLDPEPLFTRDQLSLAEFICQRYRYPIGPFLSRLLPHGLLDRYAGDLLPGTGSTSSDLADLRCTWPDAALALDSLTAGSATSVDELAILLPADRQACFVNDVVRAHVASVQPGIRTSSLASATIPPNTSTPPQEQAAGPRTVGATTREHEPPMRLHPATAGRTLLSVDPSVPGRRLQQPDSEVLFTERPIGPRVLERGTRQALSVIFADIANQRGNVFLLKGSPDTLEVVGQITRCCLSSRMQTVVLLPEVRDSDQLAAALRERFGQYPGAAGGHGVATVHSRVKRRERREQWQTFPHTSPAVIVGTRLALFTPHRSIGALIVLDEHSHNYKQEQQPRYHARDVALWQAKQHHATVVLVSATPDPVTFWQARRGPYKLFSLDNDPTADNGGRVERPHERGDVVGRDRGTRSAPLNRLPARGITGRLAHDMKAKGQSSDPEAQRPSQGPSMTARVELIDLRQELRMANITTISRQLQTALRTTLAQGRQALLMLNRRGTNTQLMCTRCGYTARCGECSVALTYHTEPERLVCHYCNHHETPLMVCPNCAGRRLHFVGTGTQRVEQDIKRCFPAARVARWDRDTSFGPTGDRAIIRQFGSGELDILVGTQLLVTGVALPSVALAAMLNTDVTLHLPDYRSAERTYYHVCALHKRVLPTGRLLLQTYSPDHWSLQAVVQHDPDVFYLEELRQRRALHYPPYSDLVRLLYSHVDGDICRAEGVALAKLLEQRRSDLALRDAAVLGPAPAFIERVRGRSRWQLFLRGHNLDQLLDVVPRGWVIDVNPVSTL